MAARTPLKCSHSEFRSHCGIPRRVALAATTLAPIMCNRPPAALPAVPNVVPEVELPGLSTPISAIIKGCWQLSGGHVGDRNTDRTSGQAAAEDFGLFYDAGIHTFDTADIYGPSEHLIGKFIASNPTKKVQVFTKFCCFGDSLRKASDVGFVEASIDASRKRLGVDSLDLIQFYWHDYSNKNYIAAAQHLQTLQNIGKVKAVGVTNFDVGRMKEMMDGGVTIATNQVQYSLLDRRPENGMTDFCKQHNIALLPYGVTAGGFLSDAYLGLQAQRVSANTYSKGKYASVIDECGGYGWFQQLLQVLRNVADRHDTVSIADVAQRWVLDKETVPAVIVGARNANHVEDHKKLFSFQLSERDNADIDAVLEQGVQSTSDCYSWERGLGGW